MLFDEVEMRLLHFADLHLGVENYGRLDPSTGLHSRLSDFTQSLEYVVDTALQEHVDLVVFAGDAYRNCNPNPTWQRALALHLRRLQEATVPIAIVVGNHDSPATFGRASSVDIFNALGLENTYVVGQPKLFHIETKSGPIQFAGLPWPTRHYLRADERFKNLSPESMNHHIAQICAAQIAEFSGQLDPALPSVLAAHVTLAEATYSGSERTAMIGDDPVLTAAVFAESAFDYVALGHIHRHQNLNPNDTPPVVYSGSIERIDFGEAAETKGVCLVDLPSNDTPLTSYRFVPTPARRFVSIEVDGSTTGDPTASVIAAIETAEIADSIVRVTCLLDEGRGERLDTARVRAALTEAHCVAAIIPRYCDPDELQRRASLSEEVALDEALDRYLDNHPSLHAERDILKKYAGRLETELATVDAGEISQP